MLTLLSLLLPLAALAAGEAEPACLLQKPKAPTQLISQLSAETPGPPVIGWEYAGKGDCLNYLGTFTQPNPASCASQCATLSPRLPGFSFEESSGTCWCCDGLRLISTSPAFAYAVAVTSWHFLGAAKICARGADARGQAATLNDCALFCESSFNFDEGWFIYETDINPGRCECCKGLDASIYILDDGDFEKTFAYRKEDVPGWDYAALGLCTTSISFRDRIQSPQDCSQVCASDRSAPEPNGFVWALYGYTCECCFGLQVDPAAQAFNPRFGYVKTDPFWKFSAPFQTCVTPVATSSHNTLADCAKSCEPAAIGKWLVYGQGTRNQCDCCGDDGLTPADPRRAEIGGLGYHLAPLTFPQVPGWRFQGRRWECDGRSLAEFSLGASPPSACGTFCASQPIPSGGMVIDQNFPATAAATCKCCGLLSPEGIPSSGSYGYLRDAGDGGVGVYGDPHITALDGSHYLLLSQGTFSLWHLHGLSTEFQAQDGAKKVPVEWEILTHYSGHQSFTKGLLLVDRSAGVQRQVLEITSQDCQWRANSGAEWSMVSKPGMISIADGQDFVTGFNMTKTNGRKHRGGHASGSQLSLNQVHISMNTKDGATDIAVLTISCRPKRNLNLNLVMKRRSDHRFVEGELAGGKKLAALETSDFEFNVKGKWQDVGGSPQAAAYLRQMDEDSSSSHMVLVQSCSAEEKVEATTTCSKYLDSLAELDRSGFFFNDCVYDVCHGAGEVAAELAAELLTSASV